jgi:hypothetical protein
MTQHFGNDNGHDDLAALDFSSAAESNSGEHEGADADALDFSAPHHDDDESPVEALADYAPAETEETGSELEAIDAQADSGEDDDGDEENGLQMFTVANPADTVAVSALIDGRAHRVELSPKVTSMAESELAAEILVLADLARQKGLAGQHTYLLENDILSQGIRDLGFDSNEVLRDFMENGIGLPTPEQAEAAQAEVFATRYAVDDD